MSSDSESDLGLPRPSTSSGAGETTKKQPSKKRKSSGNESQDQPKAKVEKNGKLNINQTQRASLIDHLKNNCKVLMSKIKMGNGMSKGEHDKAWTDFYKYAKETLKVNYRNEKHLKDNVDSWFYNLRAKLKPSKITGAGRQPKLTKHDLILQDLMKTHKIFSTGEKVIEFIWYYVNKTLRYHRHEKGYTNERQHEYFQGAPLKLNDVSQC